MPAEITLIGGASILVNYGFRASTYDVDALIQASSAMKDAINSFLAALSPEVRKIFLQRYWYCRSVKDIARDFDRDENHIYVMLHRTRKEFKAHLEQRRLL